MASDLRLDATRHREGLRGVAFIAITGSCGKTTTKELAGAILDTHLRGTTSAGSGNCGADVLQTLVRVRESDEFCLQELGAWGPGTLDPALSVVRPTVGVVLNIRRDHFSAFHGLENTQAEKSKVVSLLPSTGVAILNADDDLVLAMAAQTTARTLTFGRSSAADLRASEVTATWPDRLSFRLTVGGTEHHVGTRLVGKHLLGSALAAIAIAAALGIPIDHAVRRLEDVEPPPRRMSPVSLGDGVTFIRDDFKAPSDSMSETLGFMAEARATRKVAVIGRISDYSGRSRPTYTRVAQAGMEILDELMFVGERPYELWSREGPSDVTSTGATAHRQARVTVHRTVQEASRVLNRRLLPGDLVLLKGSGPADHLERVLLDRSHGVTCWLPHCGRTTACDDCELVRRA